MYVIMNNNKEAILIMCHNNLNILKKTISLLDSEFFDFFVHIDKKSNIEINDIKNICKKSQIYVFKEIKIRWADYSQVECEIFLLNKAVKGKYSYYHLISGVDMPLKKPKEIYDFFENSKDKEFITYEDEIIPKIKIDWIKYYYFFGRISKKSKIIKILEFCNILVQKILGINRIKDRNIIYKNGDNWFSITHKLALYVLSQQQLLEKQYKYTKSPDEIFLQTIVYNSYFKNNLYNKNYNNNHDACMRKIDWNRGRPYIYRIEDFNELISSNCMFARKFDEKKDIRIVNKLYNYLKT